MPTARPDTASIASGADLFAGRDAPPGWGAGATTGSYDAGTYTWTPGRDVNGRVNAASWDLVPGNTWVAVSGTGVEASLASQVSAAVPGYTDPGTEDWGGIVDAWNGFATDFTGCRLWFVTAGGHAASANNGIYRFDCYKMAWAIEHAPSDPADWSTQYKTLTPPQAGSYSRCWESEQETAASAINDWWQDELYWDRKPCSRHTYSATVYVPETDELIVMHRRLWRYSVASGHWTYKRQLEDGDRLFDGAVTECLYDPTRTEVIFHGFADARLNSCRYDLTANAWVNKGTNWAPWGIYGPNIARRPDNKVAAVGRIYSSGAHFGQYWLYDLTTRTTDTSGTLQYGGGLSRASFSGAGDFSDGPALCYIPSLNRYWYWTRNSSNVMTPYEIDPTTTPWTINPRTITGYSHTAHKNIEEKMIYLPPISAVVMLPSAASPMLVYKVA
jgi:hypothetical protein